MLKTKNEIANDIERLNLWVSIWIGFIGILLIFIPILLNYQTSKKIDKELEGAISKAEKAENKIDDAKPILDKVDGIDNQLNKIKQNVNTALHNSSMAKQYAESAKNNMDDAKKKSEEAVTNSKSVNKLLIAINAIGKLKSFDASKFPFISDRMDFLIKLLERILESLSKCDDEFNHDIVKDSLKELVINLYLISKFDFINRRAIEHINNFNLSVSQSFDDEFTKEKFEQSMEKLNQLINDLNSL